MSPQEFLALSFERDAAEARRLAERQEDWHAGYLQALADMRNRMDRAWAEAPLHQQLQLGPTHAELERRRWGPGGRAGAMIDPPE